MRSHEHDFNSQTKGIQETEGISRGRVWCITKKGSSHFVLRNHGKNDLHRWQLQWLGYPGNADETPQVREMEQAAIPRTWPL